MIRVKSLNATSIVGSIQCFGFVALQLDNDLGKETMRDALGDLRGNLGPSDQDRRQPALLLIDLLVVAKQVADFELTKFTFSRRHTQNT